MSFTPEQLAERMRGLGASEVAAAIGISPWRSPLELYMSKVGLIPPPVENQKMRMGNKLEPVVAELYQEEMADEVVSLRTSETVWHPKEPWAFATPDRIATRKDGGEHLLECKAFGLRQTDNFGPAGGDGVPNHVAVQAHWQMWVCDKDRCDVAVLLGGQEFRVFHLFRNAEIERGIVDAARAFWFTCVVPNEPPALDGTEASHRFLALRFPAHDLDLVPSTPEIDAVLGDLRMAQMELNASEDRVSRDQVAIKSAVGDHAGLATRLGRVTWTLNKSGGIDYKALLTDLLPDVPPETVAKYQRPGSRVLRIKFTGDSD